MSAKRVIGVDLGGTKILAGVIDDEGRVHETVERPTVTTSQDALLDELVGVVRALPHEGVERGRIRHSVADRPRARASRSVR